MLRPEMGYLQIIGDVWADRYPPERPRQHFLIEKVLMTPLVAARLLSLDNAKTLFSETGGHTFMDLYVLSFAALLTTVLFRPNLLGTFGVVIAAYRIVDIVSYRLYFMLVKSQARPWRVASLRRSVVIVGVNFYETIVGYAILYLGVGQIASTAGVLSQQSFNPTTAFYFSSVTATTLGYGDYVPGNELSRVLVVTQLGGTILFLIFVVPALLSIFSDQGDRSK